MNATIALAKVVLTELYRRKDFYVIFILTVILTLVMASANLFNDERIVGYLKEVCLLLIWISALVMAVSAAARQIPAERENRTIFPLLAKPVTRAQVIAGKFLGCWLACGVALLMLYLFLGVVSGSREHEWHLINYFQAFWMQWMFLAIVTAIVLLGSIVIAAPSSNATFCLVVVVAILSLDSHISTMAIRQSEPLRSFTYAIYILVPHFEFFDLRDFVVHNIGSLSWMHIGMASFYAAMYTSFFLVATWSCFRRKTLNQ